jgi:hypothetical protein
MSLLILQLETGGILGERPWMFVNKLGVFRLQHFRSGIKILLEQFLLASV